MPATPVDEPTEPNEPDVNGIVTSLRSALSELKLPNEVVIRDFEGKEYRLPTALPARRQVQAFKALHELVEAAQRALSRGTELSGAGILKLLVELVTDEHVVERLGQSFKAAFPTALGDRDPLDVLPVEELLAALVPILLRMLGRSGALLGEITG